MVFVGQEGMLLCNTKSTEYESNSQLPGLHSIGMVSCCVIPKVLNMKAIHNIKTLRMQQLKVVV